MRKLYIALFSAALISASAHAQQPVKLSLDDCINYALKNNPTIRNAHLDMLISEAQSKQTTAAALPHVNGKVDWNHFNIPQYSYIGASSFAFPGFPTPAPDELQKVQFTIPYTNNASISVSQVLFDGSVIVALQARNTVMELAKETEKITGENIRYNIMKAYNALVIAERQYGIIKQSLVLAREMESDLQKTRTAGFAEKIDVDRTSVQVTNLSTDSIKVSNMLVVAEQALKFNIGMEINTPIVLIDTAIEKRQQDLLSLTAAKQDYTALPEYNAQLIALKLNEFNLKRYRLAALPTLTGIYSYGQNTGAYYGKNIFNNNKYNEYSMFGLSLNAPIFNGLVRQYQVREAKLNIEKSRNNIDNMKLMLDFQVASAQTTLKNSLLQVQSQKRNLELANSILDLAQKKYKAGVGSNLEVTTAQTDLLRSQNNYFSSLLDVVNAEADLRKALGLLK